MPVVVFPTRDVFLLIFFFYFSNIWNVLFIYFCIFLKKYLNNFSHSKDKNISFPDETKQEINIKHSS